MASLITIFIYAAAWLLLLRAVAQRKNLHSTHMLKILLLLGIVGHGLELYLSMVTPGGLYLGFFKVASLFFFVINILVLISSLKTPLHNLYIFILPLAMASVLVSEFFTSPVTGSDTLSAGMVAHILLSILAYSLLTIACIQALLLAYQNKQLRTRHFHEVMGIMPPLQTMEKLLFDIVWGGFLFLTLSIVTGAIYIEDIFEQKLSHKTVFSILSWLIYGTLLTGHQIYGWRGPAAVRGVLGGFAALMLAYFGSKLVLEVILGTG